MRNHYDVVVVGAGPAGIAATATTCEHGAATALLDEQPSPGGQIHRGAERPGLADPAILGPHRRDGERLVATLRDAAADYLPGATVWNVSPDREVGVRRGDTTEIVTAGQIILATGALERPFPIPGWALPGVMTVGAAQVLLKSSGLVAPNAVFAGTGPLMYLTAWQYLRAGALVKAVLDTMPAVNRWRALPHLPAALRRPRYLGEGCRWLRDLARAGLRPTRNVTGLRVLGCEEATAIEYRIAGGWRRIEATRIFLHQGLIPDASLALAAGCQSVWNTRQLCWQVATKAFGETSIDGIAIAGDSASIGGAVAAESTGRIAALGALHRLGRLSAPERDERARPYLRQLAGETRVRPFLDALFRPADSFRVPANPDTLVCRCEEVTAREIREALTRGLTDPNQLKSISRCGMGPCQGRLCATTVSEMIARETNRPVGEVGHYRVRPPVKPLPLDALAGLCSAPMPKGPEDFPP